MLTQTARKIVAAALFFSVLGWLPLGARFSSAWWGPVPCLGQLVQEIEPIPETVVPETVVIEAESFASLSFTGSSSIIGNTLTETNNTYQAALANSFHGFAGITLVNQSVGNLSNQINWMGVAGAREGAELTLVDISYKSRVENNTLATYGNTYQASITGTSFNGGKGVALVNQSSGNMNSQLNAFSLAIGKWDGAMSLADVELSAVKANNTITLDAGNPNKEYKTTIDEAGGAFQNFTGLWSANQVAGNMDQVTTVFNVNVHTVP